MLTENYTYKVFYIFLLVRTYFMLEYVLTNYGE